MNATYVAQCAFWILALAGAGLAVRPLINRFDKGRENR